MRRSTSKVLGAAALTFGIAACGGAASPESRAPAPQSPAGGHAEPTTIEDAEAQIAAARADLERSPERDDLAKSAEEPKPRDREKKAPAESADGRVEDRCGGPCRALASMRRAVDALCRMTGDSDDRCVRGRRTLAESTSRIRSCTCT